jgi:hypothetical protein
MSISLTPPVSGATITAALHASNYAAIQAAINNDVVPKPTSIASGEVPVWDGANWVRSTTTRVGATSLGSGTPDATMYLRGDGVWALKSAKYSTLIDIVSSVTETDLLQASGYSIPANTLGINGDARALLLGDYLNNTGGNTTLTLKVYWGGTLVINTGASFSVGTSATRRPFQIQLCLANDGATNVQFINGFGILGVGASGGTGIGSFDELTGAGVLGQYIDLASNGTHAEDTTLAKVLRITATLGSSAATHQLRIRKSVVEFL